MEKKFNYKSQFGVIVVCDGEEHQKQIFEQLKALGLTLKIVCV